MIPLIDIGPLRSPDIATRRAVAQAMGEACRGVGFFYVTGHGIAQAELDQVFAGARVFFALPRDEKLDLSFRRSSDYRGYVEIGGEQLNPDDPPDRKETFSIGLELAPDDPRLGERYRDVNLWPSIAGWRELMLGYFDRCWELGRVLHQGFSLDLGIAEDFFDSRLDAPLAGLRLLHYPAASEPVPGHATVGAGAHTDYGNITILATDGEPGLQVRARQGDWLDAPAIDGALLCNIGDCLMRWSNDTYVSTPHRVVIPRHDRYSVAFFLDPNPEAIVLPLLGGEAAARRYPPITAGDYLHQRLSATHVAEAVAS